MITVAKKKDLALPEFIAFNEGQSLPRMRRWSLPFTLFQAQLSDTMSILDLSLDPGNFRERLARLFPHVLYRHHRPWQNGELKIPAAAPGETFDRVICHNTLERLSLSERAKLMAEMASRLKPGGLMIITTDYFFNTSADDPVSSPHFAKKIDPFSYNRAWDNVTPAELIALSREHDLHPMSETIEDPLAVNSHAYCDERPDPHTCVGYVFYKSVRPRAVEGKKIVLALLTWNKREVSLDSLNAYIKEARMLQRLGQSPFICVCDNGSTDGTAEALQALDAEIDIPHKFILNPVNLGSSSARNQIIDQMLEFDADYVLFIDGDIEIVPFSSFAMLRYMEKSGPRLGCVGADFREHAQTLQREKASTSLFHIDGRSVITASLICPTQYGMFRRAVFDDGIRFEEAGPFNGAGWGFEDNDLAFQMVVKRYLIQGFLGMVYLHRAAGSSVKIMREKGIEADAIFERRRQFIMDKWSGVPPISKGPLEILKKTEFQHQSREAVTA